MLMCRPHAIVCDLMLKPVDGLALLRRVRSHNLTREIPFLMVSAELNEDDFRRATRRRRRAAAQAVHADAIPRRRSARGEAAAEPSGQQLRHEVLHALGDARAAGALGGDDRRRSGRRRAADRR